MKVVFFKKKTEHYHPKSGSEIGGKRHFYKWGADWLSMWKQH